MKSLMQYILESKVLFQIGDKVRVISNPNKETIYRIKEVGKNGMYGLILPKGKNVLYAHESEIVKI